MRSNDASVKANTGAQQSPRPSTKPISKSRQYEIFDSIYDIFYYIDCKIGDNNSSLPCKVGCSLNGSY